MLNWNYRYLIVLLFCLLPSLACAGYVINSFGTFGGGGGGSGFTDTFTNSDSTALTTHSSNYKSLGTVNSVVYDVVYLEINSNKAEATAEYVNGGTYYDDTSGTPPTGTVYASGDTYDKSDFTTTMVIGVRMGLNQSGYSVRLYVHATGNWTRLSVYKDGIEMDSYNTVALDATVEHSIYVKAEDDVPAAGDVTVSVWIDDNTGAADYSRVDLAAATPIASGWPGFYSLSATSYIPTMDNFSNVAW